MDNPKHNGGRPIKSHLGYHLKQVICKYTCMKKSDLHVVRVSGLAVAFLYKYIIDGKIPFFPVQ